MSKDIPRDGPVHWGWIRGSCEWRSVGMARTTYPFVRITTGTYARLASWLSYRFVAGPGTHNTTVTRLDLFRASPI